MSDEQVCSRTVLCIGSETIGLHLRCRFLRENGWLVLSSTNGHDGIFRFAAEPVDVVVLDVNDDAAETAVIAGQFEANQGERSCNHVSRRGADLSRGRTRDRRRGGSQVGSIQAIGSAWVPATPRPELMGWRDEPITGGKPRCELPHFFRALIQGCKELIRQRPDQSDRFSRGFERVQEAAPRPEDFSTWVSDSPWAGISVKVLNDLVSPQQPVATTLVGEDYARASATHLSEPLCRLRAGTAIVNHT